MVEVVSCPGFTWPLMEQANTFFMESPDDHDGSNRVIAYIYRNTLSSDLRRNASIHLATLSTGDYLGFWSQKSKFESI